MSVTYLLTGPPPPFEGTDAVFQDIDALCKAFRGEKINLNPNKSTTRRFPKQLFGYHALRKIKKSETRHKINHIFFPSLYAFPILRTLRNPVFYTVTASLDVRKKPRGLVRLQNLHRVIVSNERDAGILRSWGLKNCKVVPPGIDATKLTPADLPLGSELTLLMASAPWNIRQFDTKGIDLLLAAAATLPFLRLILLWRGVLADELGRRVERLNLSERVEIIDRKADISEQLKRAHASIVLAEDGGQVKSFPHSLIESLMAGKPVVLSETIAMSDYVRDCECGVVLRPMTVEALISAIETLKCNYDQLTRKAAQVPRNDFSIAAMVESYRRLYGL